MIAAKMNIFAAQIYDTTLVGFEEYRGANFTHILSLAVDVDVFVFALHFFSPHSASAGGLCMSKDSSSPLWPSAQQKLVDCNIVEPTATQLAITVLITCFS